MQVRRLATLMALACVCAGSPVYAGPADVVAVRARCSAGGSCSFEVTLRHADEGWKHYADRWDVVAPSGEVIATRVLRHPHVEEQPFTRSLTGVSVPKSVTWVTIRAHDSAHGLGGKERRVELRR